MIYSKIGGSLQRGLTATSSNSPAAKFASQGDAHVRTDAQIKFLYYPMAYIHACIYIYMYICIYMYMHVYSCIYMHAFIYISISIYLSI